MRRQVVGAPTRIRRIAGAATPPGRPAWRWATLLVVAALGGGAAGAGASGAGAAEVERAPRLELRRDGRLATDGTRVLRVSKVRGLAPGGDRLLVTGEGFDDRKGIYVALCRVRVRTRSPHPCGGGVDRTGASGASAWISSNPPPYGRGLAVPYEPGGRFRVRLEVSARIGDRIDCRRVLCAVATRNDHTRSADRSQDLLVPVRFRGGDDPERPGGDLALPSTGGDRPWGALAGGAFVVAGCAAVLTRALRRRRTRAPAASVRSPAQDRRRRLPPGSGPAVALVVALAVGTAGCHQGGRTAGADAAPVAPSLPRSPGGTGTEPRMPVTVRSAEGRMVQVRSADRIVSLWGGLSEIVFELGLGDRLVGRDVATTFPEARRVPLVTRAHDVSAEAVLSRRPTVVLAQTDSGPPEALAQIRRAGVPVVRFPIPDSIEAMLARIRAVAAALGVEEAGERLARQMEARIAEARSRIPAARQPPVVAFLYLRGGAGVYLIGGPGSGADAVITAAGGVDAGTAMGLRRPFTPLTSEALVRAAPDVILCTTSGLRSVGGRRGLLALPGVAQTPAGLRGRIVTEEDGVLYGFAARTPDLIERLVQDLHR